MRLSLFLWCLWAFSQAQGISLTVDDTDSRILYSPASAWSEAVNFDQELYNGTYHYSNVDSPLNPNATLHFTFPYVGTAFTWKGLQRPDAGLFAICFDCNSTVVSSNWAVVDAVNATASELDPPVTLFSISSLSNVAHTVTICNMLDERTNSFGQLTVDAFILTVDEGSPVISSTIVSAPYSTATSLDSNPVGPANQGSQGGLKRGQIAGIVVGAVGAAVLCILAIVFCTRVMTRLSGGTTPTPTASGHSWVGKIAPPAAAIGHQPSKMPTPFILPPPRPIISEKYDGVELDDSTSLRYAHSIDPPTIATYESEPQPHRTDNRETSPYPSIRRWRTSTTTTEEESTSRSLRNASMSVMAGSLISAISGRTSSPRALPQTLPAPSQDIRLRTLEDVTQEEEDIKEDPTLPVDVSPVSVRPAPPRRSLLRVVNGPPSSARRLKGPRPLSASPLSKRRSEPI